MTPIYWIILSIFIVINIYITYTNQQRFLREKKAKDRYAKALLILITAAGKLPEEINQSADWQQALRLAVKTWKLPAAEKVKK